MRSLKLYGLLLAVVLLAACGGSKSNEAQVAEAVDSAATQGLSIPVDLAASQIRWIGSKVAVGSEHNGTVKLKSGELMLTGDQLTGGKFVIDMTSINNLDEKGEDKQKLEGHLKSADFFHVDSFPEAVFEITSVEAAPQDTNTHRITGNLTMRGVTKSVTFPAKVEMQGNTIVAKANFAIDRTLWNVMYSSDKNEGWKKTEAKWKDKLISNEIKIDLNLVANKG